MFNNITSILSIILLLVGCILYPFWWINGYLDTTYLKVSVAVACYGGLAANIVYLIKNNKK
jgi:hypothetical protein